MTEVDPGMLARLGRYDTPTICNLIELFDVRPRNTGYMDSRIRACFPEMHPMIGYAATATFRAGAPPRGGDAYASMEAQVERFAELAGPAIVVFQDLDNPSVAATFGEVMCSVYKGFGAAGLITSGSGRDLDQVRAIDFPVFTDGTCCSHGYTHIPQIHIPVHVGGIAIYPNDLLHGDRNGVTTIPADIVAELLQIADAFVAAEQVVLDAVRADAPTPARLREARAASHAQISALRAQVSRAPQK